MAVYNSRWSYGVVENRTKKTVPVQKRWPCAIRGGHTALCKTVQKKRYPYKNGGRVQFKVVMYPKLYQYALNCTSILFCTGNAGGHRGTAIPKVYKRVWIYATEIHFSNVYTYAKLYQYALNCTSILFLYGECRGASWYCYPQGL